MRRRTVRRKVRITDANGNGLYNRLYDDGTFILDFAGRYQFGFIDRLVITREGWLIVDGWHD